MSEFARHAEDVGNVIALEHVNLTVPDQGVAALFYVTAMGFTRDPYIDFGGRNMWVNVGAQQFHLPLGEPQRFQGTIHVVVPDLDDLARRLTRAERSLAGTRFGWNRESAAIRVSCPWGNDLLAHGPDAFPAISLGIPQLDVAAPPGTAEGIAAFYRDVVRAPVEGGPGLAEVRMGPHQRMVFREQPDPPGYDGHHVAVYLADFSSPHRFLSERGLVTEETDRHQYRFTDIADPTSGARLMQLEHEVRALTHPMFNRPLVNRNPAVGFGNYRQGQEVYVPA